MGSVSAISQSRAQNDLFAINKRNYERTVNENNKAFVRTARDIHQRTREERTQIAAELELLVQRAMNVRGSAVAAAGAGNVAGQSVRDVTDEVERSASEQATGLSILQTFRERTAARQIEQARFQTNARNFSAQPAPVALPDFWTLTALVVGDLAALSGSSGAFASGGSPGSAGGGNSTAGSGSGSGDIG